VFLVLNGGAPTRGFEGKRALRGTSAIRVGNTAFQIAGAALPSARNRVSANWPLRMRWRSSTPGRGSISGDGSHRNRAPQQARARV